MDIKNVIRKSIPHLIALFIFLIASIILSSPAVFEGKDLIQHDVIQGIGPGKESVDYRESLKEEPLWSSNMFSGMPAYLVNMKFNLDAIRALQKIYSLGLPHPTHYLVMSCVSYYIMLLIFGIRPWIAISGALMFGFNTFNIIGLVAGHNSKVLATLYMPLVLAGLHLTFKDKLKGFILTSIGLGMHLAANHLQITYYLLFICIAYMINQLVVHLKDKNVINFTRTSFTLLAAGLLAVGLNLGRIWTVLEYSKYSTRGPSELSESTEDSGLDKEYVFRFSNGLMEPMVLFIPNVLGGSSQQELKESSALGKALAKNGLNRQQIKQQLAAVPTYWGDQPITAPYYAGAICILFFFIGTISLSKRDKIWLISIIIIGIVLSWGSNFMVVNGFMFDHFPGYSKFRSVTFTIVIPILCLPLLGCLGLEKIILKGKTSENVKKFYTGVGIAAGVALFFILFAGFFSFDGSIDARLTNLPSWFLDALKEDREALMRTDASRSLFLVIIGSVIIWLLLYEKLNFKIISGLLILVVAIDGLGVSGRFLKDDFFQRKTVRNIITLDEADREILKDVDPGYRVFNLIDPFNDGETSFAHRSIGGYHGAKMGRYQDLISQGLSNEHQEIIQKLQNGERRFNDQMITNMLNARYFKFGPNKNNFVRNNSSNGEAWFVNSVELVNDANKEIAKTMEINTKVKAVVDASKFKVGAVSFNSGGDISMESFSPREITYNYSIPSPGFAVFSEIYYPEGWSAKIDDQEVNILRANYVLRALEVPAGQHSISFRFDPISYRLGYLAMKISAGILAMVCVWFIAFEWRKHFYRSVDL